MWHGRRVVSARGEQYNMSTLPPTTTPNTLKKPWHLTGVVCLPGCEQCVSTYLASFATMPITPKFLPRTGLWYQSSTGVSCLPPITLMTPALLQRTGLWFQSGPRGFILPLMSDKDVLLVRVWTLYEYHASPATMPTTPTELLKIEVLSLSGTEGFVPPLMSHRGMLCLQGVDDDAWIPCLPCHHIHRYISHKKRGIVSAWSWRPYESTLPPLLPYPTELLWIGV